MSPNRGSSAFIPLMRLKHTRAGNLLILLDFKTVKYLHLLTSFSRRDYPQCIVNYSRLATAGGRHLLCLPLMLASRMPNTCLVVPHSSVTSKPSGTSTGVSDIFGRKNWVCSPYTPNGGLTFTTGIFFRWASKRINIIRLPERHLFGTFLNLDSCMINWKGLHVKDVWVAHNF